eukprot:jgi/Mesvir1/15261/Mv06481-RA.1
MHAAKSALGTTPRAGKLRRRWSRRLRISESVHAVAPIMFLTVRAARGWASLKRHLSTLDCGLNPTLAASWPVRHARRFVDSKSFSLLMLGVIMANAFILAVDHHEIRHGVQLMLDIANYIFTGLFVAEMLLKMVGKGPRWYLGSKGNWFDMALVIVSICDVWLSSAGGWNVLRLFRLLRVLRLVKVLHVWPSFLAFLRVILHALTSIGNFVVMIGLILFIYAILGVQLLGTKLMCHNSGRCTDPLILNETACAGEFLLFESLATLAQQNQTHTAGPLGDSGDAFFLAGNGTVAVPLLPTDPNGSLNATSGMVGNSTFCGNDTMGGNGTIPGPVRGLPWHEGSLFGVPTDPYVYQPRLWGCDSFPRTSFRNFYWALLSVFQLLTAENWHLVLYTATHVTSPWVSLYFISFIIIGNLVMLNLLLAALAHTVVSADTRKRRGGMALAPPSRGGEGPHTPCTSTGNSMYNSPGASRRNTDYQVDVSHLHPPAPAEMTRQGAVLHAALPMPPPHVDDPATKPGGGGAPDNPATKAMNGHAGIPEEVDKNAPGGDKSEAEKKPPGGEVPKGWEPLRRRSSGGVPELSDGELVPTAHIPGPAPPPHVPDHLRRWVGIQVLRQKASLPPNPLDYVTDHRYSPHHSMVPVLTADAYGRHAHPVKARKRRGLSLPGGRRRSTSLAGAAEAKAAWVGGLRAGSSQAQDASGSEGGGCW